MYVYVCMYVCMYVRMYVYVCMYVCICMYVCMYVCMHACVRLCMNVCILLIVRVKTIAATAFIPFHMVRCLHIISTSQLMELGVVRLIGWPFLLVDYWTICHIVNN